MKSKSFLIVMITLSSFWLPMSRVAAQTDERLTEVIKLSQQGKPKEALVAGQKYLKELRGTLPEPDHPAIGYAATVAGAMASKAGEHEEAVRLLREGLPIVSRMRAEQLMVEELNFSGLLVTSLEALKRPEEALLVLEDLQRRTRKELAQRPNSAKLKLSQPGGPAVALDSILVNDDSLVTLLQKSGTLNLELKQWEKAEKDLKEAEEILRRIHPDEQQAQLVKLREGWEQALREQGKPIRPHFVGRFSMPRTIQIEGSTAIPTEQIYSALTRSTTYVLASHPSAEFDGYLKKLKHCLELGYLANGFPETTMEVDWDETKDGVLARIVDGPRFKAGEIQIRGAKALKVEDLLERLIIVKDAEEKPISREESAYRKLVESKRLPGAQALETLKEVFADSFTGGESENDIETSLFENLATTPSEESTGVWEKDAWIDYQPSFLKYAEAVLLTAYAEGGLFYPKFKLKRVPGAAPDVVDLLVEVIEEGPPAHLGKLHVAGNKNNSRDELLAYLGLKEGMELRGNFVDRVKRSLYESGRFLGWEVTPKRANANSSEIDLLIQVAEQWDAPLLSEPLTREQKAMLKFGRWITAEAGEESDLVFSVSKETELGPVDLSALIGRETISLSANGLEHHLRMVAEWDKNAEFLIQSDHGSSFRASFPIGELPLSVFLDLLRTQQADPFLPTGSIGFGSGFGTVATSMLKFAVDPTMALSWGSSQGGLLLTLENGEVVAKGEKSILRFDEQSGRLISFYSNQEGMVLTGSTQAGAVERIKNEMDKMSEGVDNWALGKSPTSLFYLAIGYLGELMQDQGLKESDSITDLMSRVAERTKRWEPLAVLLGDVTGSITEMLKSINGKSESPTEAKFYIPIDSEELSAKLQAGNIMTLLMGFGGYELLAQYIEPGTWPDLVTREILFYLDGKPFYLNQTIETLLEDDSMGPLGSLLCARLLQKAGNPAAVSFITKAKGELNNKGFTKDWTLALSGTAMEDGLGWKILKALQKLDDEKIDGFLPGDSTKIRSTLKDLVAETKKIKPQTNADTFRPVMEPLWENVLNTVVEEMINETGENLTPKVDPVLVAAIVNGAPAPRGAVRLMKKLSGSMLSRQLFPVLSSVWSLDKTASAGTVESDLDRCVTTLLFAQQMWNKGQAPLTKFVDQWSEVIAKNLGPDGRDQIAEMGMEKAQYEWWVGALIAAEVHGQQLGAKEISEKMIRDFYESRKDLFGAGEQETRLYTIRLKLEGEGAGQRKLASEIRQRIEQEGSMEQKLKVFMAEAKMHSQDLQKDQGGDHGWIQPSVEFPTDLAVEIGKIPDKSLSKVIEIKLREEPYLYLALIPDKRRPGKAAPYEKAAPTARAYAILDDEITRLKKSADIRIIPETTGPDPTNKAPEKNAGMGFVEQSSKLLFGENTAGEKKEKKKKPKTDNGKKEILNLELVIRKADEESAHHIYLLGTYAERGLAKENGIQVAIKHYEHAAKLGERCAMLRLSEIYRTGRGVATDESKAREWKEKAIALQKTPAVPDGK